MSAIIIAYCGLACDSCPIHLATLEPDPLRKQMMRAEVARICNERYGMNLQPADVNDCDGCRSTTSRLFVSCVQCEIRKCGIEKKVESCAYCPDYMCDRLQKFFDAEPSAQQRLTILRSMR